MDFSIPDTGVSLGQLLVDCRDALKFQVKTGHPRFFNQLSSGLDTICMAGEWLTATANTNMFTYEIAPVFILMEKVTLKKMREIIGWPGGLGDSILSPGGSISNLHALMAARHKMFPDCKEYGAHGGPDLVMFTSEQSHYSILGSACVIGLGRRNCVEIPTDERYRMIPEELERAILKAKAEGKTPFFVNATCGSTVIGAFDPINPIADICEKYGLWLHIDSAWGGGLLLSKKYRKSRFDGVERADSLTWNPHKLMGTLLQCSTIHLKHHDLLLSCNNMCAEYLFQPDKHYDISYDTGDKVIQCGRHNDIFKLWLMWRSRGTDGYEQQIDRLMELSEYFLSKLKQDREKFHLLVEEPQCTNVCFWYVPKRLRGIPHTRAKEIQLGEIQAKLKQRMMDTGTVMVSYQPLGDKPNFFRNIVSNHAVREEDIDFLVSEFDRLGEDL